MKKLILALSLLVYGIVCQAESVPTQLTELLPVGSDNIQLHGTTPDGGSCVVDISNHSSVGAFSIVAVDVTESKSAKLQIGLGHELEEIFDTENKELVVKKIGKINEVTLKNIINILIEIVNP